MSRRRLTYAQIVQSGRASKYSKDELALRKAQDELQAVQAKNTKRRPSSAVPMTGPGKASKLASIPAAPVTNTEESSLESFLLQVRQSRESFAQRIVPGSTVALDVSGEEFDWRPEHPLSTMRRYAQEIVQGGQVAGALWIRGCARFLRDLETGHERGLFVDPCAIQNLYDWFVNFGEAGFTPLPWELLVCGQLFGWKKPSGLRRFRECWLSVAKKQGKTYLQGSLALYLLVADERNGEIVVAANSREQAKICFRAATRIWNGNEALHCAILKYQNSFTFGNSVFQIVSSETRSADGPNISGLFLDEIHEFPDGELVEKYSAGTIARPQPITFYATTAGDRKESYGGQKNEYFEKLLTGLFESDDQLAFIASLDTEDNFKDESVWGKANVSLGTTVQVDALRAQIKEIEQDQSLQTKFERYFCNRWLSASASHTFPINKIELCSGPMPELNAHELREWFIGNYCTEKCFGGFDLGLVDDLCAWISLYPSIRWPEQELGTPSYAVVVPHFWMPADKVADREKQWRVPVRQWVKEGWIHTMPGDILDMALLKEDLRKICSGSRFISVGFDAWHTETLCSELMTEKAARFVAVPKQEAHTTQASVEFKHAVLSGALCYLRNPVYKWMLQNVVLDENKRGGLIPAKISRSEKIDGIDATIYGWNQSLDPENRKLYAGTYSQYFFLEGKTK